MNLNPFTVKDSHKHIGSNIKLRLDRQGKVDDRRSNNDEKARASSQKTKRISYLSPIGD